MESFYDITLYNITISTYPDIEPAKRKIIFTYCLFTVYYFFINIMTKIENKRENIIKFKHKPALKLMDQIRESPRYYYYVYVKSGDTISIFNK